SNLGMTLQRLGRRDDAIDRFKSCLALRPDHFEALNNLGNALVDASEAEAATGYLSKALSLNPDNAKSHNNMGVAQQRLFNNDEAVGHFERALDIDPAFAEAHGNYGAILTSLNRLEEAFAAIRRALEICPDDADSHSNLIFALDFDVHTTRTLHLEERLRWNDAHAKPLVGHRRPLKNRPDPDRRLRIGYMSGDFRNHSAAYLFGPVLLHHDRENFEVYCYSNALGEDDLTARFRDAVYGWRSIVGETDTGVADMIRADGIDILVDLSGHTKGNRLLVFARKPAPLQVTAWGHASGTGIDVMDYLFSDPVLLPEDSRQYVRERIVDLPCAFGYICPDQAPPVVALPAIENRYVTFGCFNRTEKISAEAFDLWAELLLEMPDARLILKDKPLNHQAQRQRMLAEFERRGILPERIELIGHSSWADHMAAYGAVDIGLDPFPHNGGLTTMESLWMGVPVVTLMGSTSCGRATASILTAAGLGDWIGDSADGYRNIARDLADDVTRLAGIRAGLREKLATSTVGHAPTYVGAVEDAYRSMWREWCGKQP
ncbi:MAG: O-linked N-acetylglucosamine transferase, SPINDLY family protein, partial [Alphaproteobacteria bacterium]